MKKHKKSKKSDLKEPAVNVGLHSGEEQKKSKNLKNIENSDDSEKICKRKHKKRSKSVNENRYVSIGSSVITVGDLEQGEQNLNTSRMFDDSCKLKKHRKHYRRDFGASKVCDGQDNIVMLAGHDRKQETEQSLHMENFDASEKMLTSKTKNKKHKYGDSFNLTTADVYVDCAIDDNHEIKQKKEQDLNSLEFLDESEVRLLYKSTKRKHKKLCRNGENESVFMDFDISVDTDYIKQQKLEQNLNAFVGSENSLTSKRKKKKHKKDKRNKFKESNMSVALDNSEIIDDTFHKKKEEEQNQLTFFTDCKKQSNCKLKKHIKDKQSDEIETNICGFDKSIRIGSHLDEQQIKSKKNKINLEINYAGPENQKQEERLIDKNVSTKKFMGKSEINVQKRAKTDDLYTTRSYVVLDSSESESSSGSDSPKNSVALEDSQISSNYKPADYSENSADSMDKGNIVSSINSEVNEDIILIYDSFKGSINTDLNKSSCDDVVKKKHSECNTMSKTSTCNDENAHNPVGSKNSNIMHPDHNQKQTKRKKFDKCEISVKNLKSNCDSQQNKKQKESLDSCTVFKDIVNMSVKKINKKHRKQDKVNKNYIYTPRTYIVIDSSESDFLDSSSGSDANVSPETLEDSQNTFNYKPRNSVSNIDTGTIVDSSRSDIAPINRDDIDVILVNESFNGHNTTSNLNSCDVKKVKTKHPENKNLGIAIKSTDESAHNRCQQMPNGLEVANSFKYSKESVDNSDKERTKCVLNKGIQDFSLFLDLTEDPVDFEIPLLHKYESVQVLTKTQKEDIKCSGVPYKSRKFSAAQDKIIKSNFEDFAKRYGLSDPFQLLDISRYDNNNRILKFIKAKHFYLRLAKGLNRYSIRSVYKRARFILHPASSAGTFTSILDCRESPVDFEVPFLHRYESVYPLTKTQKEDIKCAGVPYKSGKYSVAEDDIIKANFEDFARQYGVSDPIQLFGIGRYGTNNIVAKFIKAKHFYLRLAKGLNNRQISSVYDRARVILCPGSSGKLTARGITRLQELHGLQPNMWEKIAANLGHSAISCRNVYKWIDVTKGKFSHEEERQLIGAMKEVLGSADISWENMKHIKIWEEIASLVPTRNAVQCRQYWAYHLRCAQNAWNDDCNCKLVRILSDEPNVVSAALVDWHKVYKSFEDFAPSPFAVRRYWNKLKHQVPDFENIGYTETIKKLCTMYHLAPKK